MRRYPTKIPGFADEMYGTTKHFCTHTIALLCLVTLYMFIYGTNKLVVVPIRLYFLPLSYLSFQIDLQVLNRVLGGTYDRRVFNSSDFKQPTLEIHFTYI